MKIENLEIIRELDHDPDFSWIGSYSDKPGKGAIDLIERGDWERGNYRYFNPANEENAEQEYARMQTYNHGDWCFVGIRAVAEVIVKGTIQKIHSGGLWGIESDSGESYFKEVAKEEYQTLCNVLKSMGIKKIPPMPEIEDK